MPFKILVVDDKIDDKSEEISRLPDMLRAAGYEVRTTSDGNQAYDLVWEYHPDLVVLDIVFENQSVDGIEICEAIRYESEVPIILVTAIMKETEKVLRDFEVGADDYVIREIIARSWLAFGPTCHRRWSSLTITFGSISLDTGSG